MLHQLPTLAYLIKVLQQVPYLASKNIYRVATHFLYMNEEKIEQFCMALRLIKEKLEECKTCFYWKEKEQECIFCGNKMRDQSLICVIESWDDLLTIEKTRAYSGVYHILGGVISPLEGVGADELTIEALVKRVERFPCKEIILATSQTPEGEATAAFIARKLKNMPISISCLARGLPVGASLNAVDPVTIYKSLVERRPF